MTDFLDSVKDPLSFRYPTMRLALDLLKERGGRVIVETGCARQENDWGAGMSTLIFAHWCQESFKRDLESPTPAPYTLYSVDISLQNLQTARRIIGDKLSPFVTFQESDSVEWLQHLGDRSVDLVYLDSMDYPWVEMLQAEGGTPPHYPEALKVFYDMTEEAIVAKYGYLINPCQQHCLNELLAVQHALKDSSIVLIDDANIPGGGKPRLAIQELARWGWTRLSKSDDQQSLWVKE